jgi:3-mercaptopyruvate sulfurtransferase SseA
MKKFFLLILILLLGCTMVACIDNHTEPTDTSTTETGDNTNSENQEQESEPESITYSNMADIKAIMETNEDYIIVDVRTFEEYCEGHIPGAINIPNEDIVDVPPEAEVTIEYIN